MEHDALQKAERVLRETEARLRAAVKAAGNDLKQAHEALSSAKAGLHTSRKLQVELKTKNRELARAENQFRALLEAAPDAIVIVNRQGEIVLVNTQAERIFGYHRSELLGQQMEMLMPERFHERHPKHRQAFASAPRSRPMGAGLDLLARRKDGSELPVEICLSPIETDEGLLVISAIRDVTDRKQGERALQLKNMELKQAVSAKDRFLGTMSHELRTPLNAIIGFTGTLLMELPGPLTDDQREQLELVRSSARHQLSLINDLLDLVKIESGKVELNLLPLDLCEIVKEVVATLRPFAETKGLQLLVQLPPAGQVLATDRRALSQILINLINNAIKFTDTGTVRIDLKQEDHQIFLAVTDTGIGIAPSDTAQLFEPFVRLENSEAGMEEGTGLGLHLSRKLAELLHGRISVESAPGLGSTFTLILNGDNPQKT